MIKADVDKTLVIGCIHTPYEDTDAVAAALDFAVYWKPDRLVLNGDILDLYALSKHRKDPDKARLLHEEIDSGRELLSKIRKAVGKNCEIIYNQGNHEFRWETYTIDGAPEMNNVDDLQFDSIFRLDKLGMRYNRGPGGFAVVRIGLVDIGHFPVIRKNSADTAMAIVQNAFGSVIAHHSHRMGTYGKSTPNGRFIGQEGGCLCTMNPSWTTNPDWEQGFVIMQKQESKPRYHIDPIRVVGGNILFDGRLF